MDHMSIKQLIFKLFPLSQFYSGGQMMTLSKIAQNIGHLSEEKFGGPHISTEKTIQTGTIPRIKKQHLAMLS
jgi:hypothetical protein